MLGLAEKAPLKLWALENRPTFTTTAAAVVMHAVGGSGVPKVLGLKVRYLYQIRSCACIVLWWTPWVWQKWNLQ